MGFILVVVSAQVMCAQLDNLFIYSEGLPSLFIYSSHSSAIFRCCWYKCKKNTVVSTMWGSSWSWILKILMRLKWCLHYLVTFVQNFVVGESLVECSIRECTVLWKLCFYVRNTLKSPPLQPCLLLNRVHVPSKNLHRMHFIWNNAAIIVLAVQAS